MAVDGYLAIEDPTGDVEALGGLLTIRARGRFSDDIGAFAAGGTTRVDVVAEFPDFFGLGGFRGAASNYSDAWAGLGLPPPTVSSYQYTGGPGLIRTAMESGEVRQRRKWTDRFQTARVSVVVPIDQLGAVEAFIDDKGYEWFGMGLVTGLADSVEPVAHMVRIMADPGYSEVFGDTLLMSLDLELQGLNETTPVPEPPTPVDGTLMVVRLSRDGSVYTVETGTTLPQLVCSPQTGVDGDVGRTQMLFAIFRQTGTSRVPVAANDAALAGLAFTITGGAFTVANATVLGVSTPVATLTGAVTCAATSEDYFVLPSLTVIAASVTAGTAITATSVTLNTQGIIIIPDGDGTIFIFTHTTGSGFDANDYGYGNDPRVTCQCVQVAGGGGGGVQGGGAGGTIDVWTYKSPVGWGVSGITVGAGGAAGAAGGDTFCWGMTVAGGAAGSATVAVGGAGGSGNPPDGVNGGNGKWSELSGTNTAYAGGGGGIGGVGGRGGGGAAGVAGTNGLGGGGGAGKRGGSGIIIMRFSR